MKKQPLWAVYCFIENKEETLLVQDTGKPGWKIPGGKVDYGEEILKTLKRELAEEVGLKVDVSGIVCIQEYVKKGEKHRLRLFFRGKLAGGELKFVDGEVCRAKWINKKEMVNIDEKKFFKDIYYQATKLYLKGLNCPIEFLNTVKK